MGIVDLNIVVMDPGGINERREAADGVREADIAGSLGHGITEVVTPVLGCGIYTSSLMPLIYFGIITGMIAPYNVPYTRITYFKMLS